MASGLSSHEADSSLSVSRHRTLGCNFDEEATIGLQDLSQPKSESTLRADITEPVSEEFIFTRSWYRFTRKGRRNVGVLASLKAILFSSFLNTFLVFIPLAWAAHFKHWHEGLTLALCVLAVMPLSQLLEYGGEQLAIYCGKDLGDHVIVTLNNVVEATLAIILLTKCEIRLLQSTIIGVVVLHLLLIPGTAFFTGGARIMEQELHPHVASLNHVLLTIGVLTLMLPAAFFAASGRDAADATNLKTDLLQMSRGLAIILLCVYICSRIYLHDPPGENDLLSQHPLAPSELKEAEHHLMTAEPEVNQWVCLVMLAVTIALMAATGEWLVDSIEPLRDGGQIRVEFFGLVILPLISFSADGAVHVFEFIRRQLGQRTPPTTMAKAQAIDMSVQFVMFWAGLLVLLGWWTDKPMLLLFDLFEVCVVIGACLLLNYVTADSKTNYAEGFAMVAFYTMIALCSWFYTGQDTVKELLLCPGVVE
ncbi:hypothetical protein C8J56DRAFT_498096 [Mycena floridula]|nr:hypothetical protein C8J56DRAFT_498096 [Mycena floridula]